MKGASPEYPRDLLFGDDARLIIAFNGRENQGGYRKLEVIEATDAGPLEFHEIRFSADGKTKSNISQANPKGCRECHGDQSGYRWSGYSTWPGMYGSDDDSLIEGSRLAAKFDAFRLRAKKDAHYSALIFREGEENFWYPYYTDKPKKVRDLDRMPNTRLSKAILRNEARARVALNAKRFW